MLSRIIQNCFLAAGDTNLYRYAGNAPIPLSPTGSGSDDNCFTIFSEAFAHYLNPFHNDPGTGWFFGTGKVLGWSMFVVGSAGAGILSGGSSVAAIFGVSQATGYTLATAGAVAGGKAAAMQTYAANPNAGLHEYAFGVGLGAGFGGYAPIGGLRPRRYHHRRRGPVATRRAVLWTRDAVGRTGGRTRGGRS